MIMLLQLGMYFLGFCAIFESINWFCDWHDYKVSLEEKEDDE